MKGKTRVRPAAPVRKLPTGIAGFDEMLEGGVPRGRALLVSGGAGTGKTVLMNEFLYRGIERFGESGVLVTFEERPEDILRNVAGFGWDYAALVARRKLAIVDASPAGAPEREVDQSYDLEPLLLRVAAAVRRTRAKRLVLDSLEGIFGRLSNRAEVREMLFRLSVEAKALGVTMMISAESTNGATRHGVEEFVADGMIELSAEPGQQKIIRHIVVRKMRGAGYRSGRVQFDIASRGLQVFPKLPVDRSLAITRLESRKSFGIDGFDELIDGGLPEGFMVLISGNTGTGKSLFAQHFIAHGVRHGESAVFVALEEPSGQVRRLAAGRGWNLAAWERQGRLAIVDVPLIDIRPDEVLWNIAEAVGRVGAKRLVIDSISSLESATMEAEQVRQFMIRLGEFCKSQAVTCVMTWIAPVAFGAERGQLLSALSSSDARLSSAVDGVILQRYVERDQGVRKLVNVLKMRGVAHDTGIHSYEIGRRGVEMGGRFEE